MKSLVSQAAPNDLLSTGLGQLGAASAVVLILLYLLNRAYSDQDKRESAHQAEVQVLRDQLEAKNDKLLTQHAELSERLLRQAVETAPLLREALDLLRQAAVMFESMKQSSNGRP